MPIHNWSGVSDGMFHWFHQTWIVAIAQWLNHGRLPEGFYAIGEVYANNVEPDVLAVEDRPPENGRANGATAHGFGVVTFGAGAMFNNTLALLSEASVPIGLANGSPTFALTLDVSLGR